MKSPIGSKIEVTKVEQYRWTAPLAFLSLALLYCQVGYLLPEVSRAFGGILWLFTVYLSSNRNRWLWLLLSALLLFNPFGAVPRPEGVWLLGLLPWAGGSWGRRWMGAAWLAAISSWVWSNFPGWWVPLDEFTAAAAQGLSGANLSTAAAGLPLFGLAISFPLCALLLERRRFASLITGLGLLLALLLFWWCFQPLGNLLRQIGVFGIHDAFNLQWVLLLFFVVVLFVWGWFDPPRHAKTPKKNFWLIPAFCLLGVLLVGWSPSHHKPNLSKEIVFYNKGYLNWDLPKYGLYGKHAGGMFGLIPEFLRWKGFQVSLTDTMSQQVLAEAGVLVFINVKDPLSADEEKAIWQFVEKGGSLLLLGDHTGLGNIRDPSNHLLKPFGIELNFDSAKPYRTGWVGALATPAHPLSAPLGLRNRSGRNPGETQIWVGASLQVRPPAYPVLVGREGFSDIGNPANAKDGYLGDFAYRPNERLGNMVLVAEAHSGRGKVLVFGDTSTIQNGALVRAGDFVERMFLYLLSPVTATRSWFKILGLFLLIAGVVFWRLSRASEKALALGALVLFFGAGICEKRMQTLPTDTKLAWTQEAWQRALIDHNHTPRSPLNQTSIDGHWGLQNCLMRSGLLPQTLERWDREKLRDARVMIEIAPVQDFSKRERRDLADFMNQGGLLIVCCGREEFDGSATLLQEYGLQPVYVPLGPYELQTTVPEPPETDSVATDSLREITVHFHKAWETKVSNPTAEVLLQGYEKPLVVFVKVGQGGLLYIPDTDFLSNLNLESPTADPFEGNILYLRYLWEEYAGGE